MFRPLNSHPWNVGIGGAFAFNTLKTNTIAFLRDSEVITVGSANTPSIQVNAEDASTIYSDGGGVALLISRGAQNPTNIGIGIGVAINLIEGGTQAFVENSTMTATAGNVIINALYDPTIDALTIGGAGAVTVSNGDSTNITGGNYTNLSFAASFAVNEITSQTRAYLVKPTVNAKDVSVTATSDALIDSKTLATIRDIVVSANTGTLTVEAKSMPTIRALSMGGAGAVGYSQSNSAFTFAGAGAGSGNDITSVVNAAIDDIDNTSGTLVTAGTLRVLATDTSTIVANAGGIALALGIAGENANINVSIGVSVAINSINSQTLATVNDATARALVGSESVLATSSANIEALTIAGAGAIALSTGSSGFGVNVAGAGTGSGKATEQ